MPDDADGAGALEALAEEAFTAGDLVGYRELRERAGSWPPPTGISAAEMQAIASGDLDRIKPMLERNAERGAIDAARMLIDRVEGKEAGHPQLTLPTELVPRTSG